MKSEPGFDDCDWIFFDCFNTLIDDFDEQGEEWGLGTLPERTVELGLFSHPDAFLAAYHRSRVEIKPAGKETLLTDRLLRTLSLSPRQPLQDENDTIVSELLLLWENEYLKLIRPTPGVDEMLVYWSARKPLGVVSNFFLPGYPERFLRQFGLAQYFRFILDSASFGYRKPDRRIFDQALALAKMSPGNEGRITYIGDRIDLDITPAQEFGMRPVYFDRSRMRPKSAVRPHAVHSISSWDDFR